MSSAVEQDLPLADTLAEMRDAVAALAQRVAALESALAAQPGPGSAGYGSAEAVRNQTASDNVTPEVLAVISAVLAAYLGVRPHIRQISLVGGAAWAQQGRVTVQASHALAIQRD